MKYRTDERGFGVDLIVALTVPIGLLAVVCIAVNWLVR